MTSTISCPVVFLLKNGIRNRWIILENKGNHERREMATPSESLFK